ncbi:hypothetical protein AST00_10500 [Staphylococcus equorum]|uniref:hypothetical protein n=1 Tax=Staphylococcus equorum TaxID=246432 RepID=UPI0008528E83|nr:hypothetical protein [Staphylococcus equorum]OEK64536.1 hypothetical protein AST00_10500 [Staphylococcus equorum]OEK65966.1 hypothetical protein AST02_13270 [Staphylococcus equorum]
MENFNYENRYYLALNQEDLKLNKEKIEWIFTNYEQITFSVKWNKNKTPILMMNGYKIASISNLKSHINIHDLKGEFNFNNTPLLRVSCRF